MTADWIILFDAGKPGSRGRCVTLSVRADNYRLCGSARDEKSRERWDQICAATSINGGLCFCLSERWTRITYFYCNMELTLSTVSTLWWWMRRSHNVEHFECLEKKALYKCNELLIIILWHGRKLFSLNVWDFRFTLLKIKVLQKVLQAMP